VDRADPTGVPRSKRPPPDVLSGHHGAARRWVSRQGRGVPGFHPVARRWRSSRQSSGSKARLRRSRTHLWLP